MERVTRAKAARLLGVDKSTMTRWVQHHPALLGDDGLVDLQQLRQHRDTVINPKLQTRKAARPRPAGAEEGGAATGIAAAAPAPAGPNLNLHRERGEYAKAVNQELDLAERLKLTLVRAEVESAVKDAGEALRRTAATIARDEAEKLARIEDPRQMERALDDLMRKVLAAGSAALIKALSDSQAADDADLADEADAA